MSVKVRSDALVLFGGTGDLARRKIYPALLSLVRSGALDGPVIVVAHSDLDEQGLRDYIRETLREQGRLDDAVFAKLAPLLRYVRGDYRQSPVFTALRAALVGCQRPLYYLAIPPAAFPVVVDHLGDAGSVGAARVVVEKPFGRDLASAHALNRTLHRVFAEHAIFRIDHYLGKEAVQNLFYFRFANSFLEPIFNRHYVANVQLTMAEQFGVEGRGAFYDSVGALRDVVQNHLLQVATLLAMEPPNGSDADALHDEKVKVLRAMRPLAPDDVVRGQYRGYRDEPGVAADSNVETFAAMQLYVDSWRWSGVPFYIRAGKRLPVTATEVVVELRRPPHWIFDEPPSRQANYARFRLGPDRVAIALGVRAKAPGTALVGGDVELYCANERGPTMDAYERLIGDAMRGDSTLFAREDAVEAAWQVLEPVLRPSAPVHEYEGGNWGPPEAAAITAASGGWQAPAPAA